MGIHAVVMAGGSGTRLWPLSRASHPKQFLALHGDSTMLQSTVKRIIDLDIESLTVICNEEHRFFVAEQLREINSLGNIILEPMGKNTAPAIALAALSIQKDGLMLVLSADHLILNEVEFVKSVHEAISLAASGNLVTFGIDPHEPNIGYGYIKKGKKLGAGYCVDRFQEKPGAEIAKSYVESGEYYWNSGMFLFRSDCYLEDLNKFRPDIYQACLASIGQSTKDLDFLRIDSASFELCPSESIDYAVMEKTSRAVVVPMQAQWSDIGSWSSLWDVCKKDLSGNFTSGDVILKDCENNYIYENERLIAAVGVSNLVIVDTKDAILVSHKDRVGDVKSVVEKLKSDSRSEWNLHREVYRPWGKYDSIDSGDNYQVKRLTVKPGAKLSVQMHYHRSEHWVVVAGTARVHYGDDTRDLHVNESTYHDKEVIHALENPTDQVLELIEVQVGEYLGEDDIVRFEDKYGRA